MLHQLADLLKMFCPSGGLISNALSLSTTSPLSADALREKPALVQSILEEMADFGYPQVTQAESLCELVLDTPSLEVSRGWKDFPQHFQTGLPCSC